MDAKDGHQSADIVSHKGRSAQEEYYRYKLLESKLKNLQDDNADPLLTVTSEREAIEMNILRKLILITESSPEFSQVVDITGSRDRYEQARILSEVVYDKVRAETILGFYTPPPTEMKRYFLDRTGEANVARIGTSAEFEAIKTAAGNSVTTPASITTALGARKASLRTASGIQRV
jgi:hypothetical protein